ncbi:hypothetical protein V6N12_045075 [Hibiscus sabdariffa]|uniref:DNA (cytosine-5-)-methyltransferase n=1 Tax=Hibiscus sabdariffa TaxID=183260 RepID=A0ABR2G2B4_9ROSI
MVDNISGVDSDNFNWDTEDELETDNYAVSSNSDLSIPCGEAVLGLAEASSSGESPSSKIIDQFVGMGFSREMVAKVIEEKGEENSNLILETLLDYSASTLPSSSNSKTINHFVGMGFSEEIVVKVVQENREGSTDGILETLLTYSALETTAPVQQNAESDNFSSDYEESLLDDFSDFDSFSETEEIVCPASQEERKLLHLTKMGYSEAEASVAMERCGPDSTIEELTDFICAAQMAKAADALFPIEDQKPLSNDSNHKKRRNWSYDLLVRKKKKKLEKRFDEDAGAVQLPNPMIGFGVPTESKQITRVLPEAGVGPPYFYYENVALCPKGVWTTISRFLYDVEPEFVDSKFFCAAARKRGYVHNLPIENRFPLAPFPPRTIHEAFPLTRTWWPSWDTRTKLNCLQTCIGSARLTDRIRKALEDYDGAPPLGVQNGNAFGFPRNHTRGGGISRTDRYKSLGNSFQVDTVAYHFSVLKDKFPGGINLLSLFSGIGGAEVALHRLRIPLKTVVSVEISEVNRNILRSWWEQTNQRGTLIEIPDVQEVDGDRLEQLIKTYGGFDLVVGGSPCNNLTGSNRYHRDGLEGKDSALFFDYCRILDSVKCIMSGTKSMNV